MPNFELSNSNMMIANIEHDDEEIKEASEESDDSSLEGPSYRERGKVVLTMDEIERLSRQISNSVGKDTETPVIPVQSIEELAKNISLNHENDGVRQKSISFKNKERRLLDDKEEVKLSLQQHNMKESITIQDKNLLEPPSPVEAENLRNSSNSGASVGEQPKRIVNDT